MTIPATLTAHLNCVLAPAFPHKEDACIAFEYVTGSVIHNKYKSVEKYVLGKWCRSATTHTQHRSLWADKRTVGKLYGAGVVALKSGVARKKQCPHFHSSVSACLYYEHAFCHKDIISFFFCSLMSRSVSMFSFLKKLTVVSSLESYFVVY